jgi:hypothetical protein
MNQKRTTQHPPWLRILEFVVLGTAATWLGWSTKRPFLVRTNAQPVAPPPVLPTFEELVKKYGTPPPLSPVVPDNYAFELETERIRPISALSVLLPNCKPTGYTGLIKWRSIGRYLGNDYFPASYIEPYCKFPVKPGKERNPIWIYRSGNNPQILWKVYFQDGYPVKVDQAEIKGGRA